MSGGLIRAKDIQSDDVLDKIFKAWVSHRVEDLPIRELRILERMEYADAKLREGGVASIYKNLVEDMRERFKDHAVGNVEETTNSGMLSTRTIESDIARAKRFFLSARPREDKEYARGKYIEWGERKLWKLDEEEDNVGYVLLFDKLSKLQQFHKEDIERPDYSAVQPPPIMVVVSPADIGVPLIDNLEEEIRILSAPKVAPTRSTQNFDEAEVVGGDE